MARNNKKTEEVKNDMRKMIDSNSSVHAAETTQEVKRVTRPTTVGKIGDGAEVIGESLVKTRVPFTEVAVAKSGFVVTLATTDIPVGTDKNGQSYNRVLSSASLAKKITKRTNFKSKAVEGSKVGLKDFDGFVVLVGK